MAFERKVYDRVRDELTKKFDRLIIFEVMSQELERAWWTPYRAELEARFRQEKLIMRATSIEQL